MDENHIEENNTVVCMQLTFLPPQQKTDGGGKISCQKILLREIKYFRTVFTVTSNIYNRTVNK